VKIDPPRLDAGWLSLGSLWGKKRASLHACIDRILFVLGIVLGPVGQMNAIPGVRR